MSALAPEAAPPLQVDDVASRLLRWYDRHGRHDLPWQHPRTPYRVWLSEIMLQQTQVATVIPYFERFVAALPDLPALARAERDVVLGLWSGLGYYSRARNLHAAAQRCMTEHGGALPDDIDALQALPGIGRSTAAAILSQALGQRHAILDGNVRRVLCRYHGIEGWPGDAAVQKRLWTLAQSHLPHARLADWTQAQMDFGATQCTRAKPACGLCPLREDCIAWNTGRVAELPSPRPTRATPERETCVLVAVNARGEFLLQRRPDTGGVWGGLWSLPEFDDPAALKASPAARDRVATPLPDVRHAFTHYRLTMHPTLVLDVADAAANDDDLRWFARGALASLGLPAPIRRLLHTVDITH